MSTEILNRADLRTLAQVGLMAAGRADMGNATPIFEALETECPQRSVAYVGMALAYLNVGRMIDAVRTLDRGLMQVDDSDRPEIYAFRGLALQLAGRSSESLRSLEAAGDYRLAKVMLGLETRQETEDGSHHEPIGRRVGAGPASHLGATRS